MDRSLFVDVVAEEGRRVAEIARSGPLDARVPHMLRWRLTDVVAHLGGVHRWAAGIAAARTWSGAGHRRGDARGGALVEWFEAGLAELTAVLTAADLDASCPNFSPGSPGTVGFWARRQAHETTVHRWDAEAAVGRTSPIGAELATDGIDEVLAVFRRTRGGQLLDAPLALVTADTGARWRVSPAVKAGRIEISTGEGAPDDVAATVAAPAEALLLALWGRRSLSASGVHITGRVDLAHGFMPGPRLP